MGRSGHFAGSCARAGLAAATPAAKASAPSDPGSVRPRFGDSPPDPAGGRGRASAAADHRRHVEARHLAQRAGPVRSIEDFTHAVARGLPDAGLGRPGGVAAQARGDGDRVVGRRHREHFRCAVRAGGIGRAQRVRARVRGGACRDRSPACADA
ncbi:hypothetical protein G6F57_019374 [Rhizopus arrhizus]|nr:hypothetical protein G6F65_020625 [Rhizopus arrhizus]KAG1439518.1 hypothetical protein G6F57_019374 [Rhizopus arrhizus]